MSWLSRQCSGCRDKIELVVSCLQRVQARNGRAESCRSLEMERMRIVRGGAAVNRCVSVSSLKLLNNLQLFSIHKPYTGSPITRAFAFTGSTHITREPTSYLHALLKGLQFGANGLEVRSEKRVLRPTILDGVRHELRHCTECRQLRAKIYVTVWPYDALNNICCEQMWSLNIINYIFS